MTTIYFIPDKAGKAFVAPSGIDGCLMDTAVFDTSGLIRFVEDECGIHNEDASFNERICHYYKAVRRWIEEHPSNVLCASFNIARLSTTRQMLLWRDELKMAQWDFVYNEIDSRLGALAGIEKEYQVKGLPDRIIAVCKHLEETSSNMFEHVCIRIPVESPILRPIIKRLLSGLEKHGAKIELIPSADDSKNNISTLREILSRDGSASTTLNTDDKSFDVLKFETKSDLMEYMTICQPEFDTDLWIDANGKEIDNRLTALNRPTSGSVITSRSRVLNLLPLALSLYDEQLQINKLVEWFSTPIHPLPGRFRFQLAEQIARSGGYINKESLDVIQKYINGDYEYPHDKDKELSEAELNKVLARRKKNREENALLYIPYIHADYRTAENAERTLTSLKNWARQRVVTLAENDDREALAIQLTSLANSIDILMLLFVESEEQFDLSLANEWMKYIPMEITLPHHPARVGCTFTIASPIDIVSPVGTTVWNDMESGDTSDFECDFLLPGERKSISENAKFWSIGDESRYRYECSIHPFRMTAKRLTIAYAVKDVMEPIVPHPLITRLKSQVDNFDEFEKTPSLVDKMCVKVQGVNNSSNKLEYKFKGGDKIRIPSNMSATSLESLTMYPFDFVFERILNYQSAGLSNLPDIQTTRGKVAHATIASLFEPRDGEEYTTASDIRKRFGTDYEDALAEAIKECGAILLLKENKLELNTLQYQLKRCIDNLIDILDVNNLRVEACERHYSKHISLSPENNPENEDDLHGFLDLKLLDGNNNHVVFDFKWSGSRSYHKSLLEKNRSSQLAVYAELIREEGKNTRTAYFIMPRGRLYSTHQFEGRNVEVVERQNFDDIMQQLINSYRFRREQIMAGTLEEGELKPIEELSYYKRRAELNLFALPGDWEDDTVKGANKFSNYTLFKGSK